MRMRTSVQTTSEHSKLFFCTKNEGKKKKKIHCTSAVCRKTYISIKHIVFGEAIRFCPQANSLENNEIAWQPKFCLFFSHRIFLLVSGSAFIAIESDLRNSLDFASMANIMMFHRIIEQDILYFILILDRCLWWFSVFLFLCFVSAMAVQRQC